MPPAPPGLTPYFLPLDSGTTASGPASPIRARVGLVTIPPVASSGTGSLGKPHSCPPIKGTQSGILILNLPRVLFQNLATSRNATLKGLVIASPMLVNVVLIVETAFFVKFTKVLNPSTSLATTVTTMLIVVPIPEIAVDKAPVNRGNTFAVSQSTTILKPAYKSSRAGLLSLTTCMIVFQAPCNDSRTGRNAFLIFGTIVFITKLPKSCSTGKMSSLKVLPISVKIGPRV